MTIDKPSSRASETPRLLHFIPHVGIGGVEVASERGARDGGGALRTHFLANPRGLEVPECEWITAGPFKSALGIGATRRAVGEVRRQDPDIILFSLWRSFPAFVAIRLLFPNKRIITFLHNTVSNTWVNALVTRLMVLFSDSLLADSAATAASPRAAGKPARPVSMLVHANEAMVQRKEDPSPAPLFVSWCRLNPQKRIHLALEFIAELKKKRPDVRYSVIGPDHGSLEFLRSETKRLGLTEQVEFLGPRDRAYLEEAAERSVFYLQLSSFEGQSLAVGEAMQLGLVPVVTPVGGIADYCEDGVNAVFYSGARATAERIDLLLNNPEKLRELSAAAQSQFSSTKCYTQDLIEAVREIEASR